MKLVYQLSNELKRDPARVVRIQAVTLDASRPKMGRKGTFGLYGSEGWWSNIVNGSMPRNYVCGVIARLYHAGQDADDDTNSFDLLLDDGSTCSDSIYCDDDKDISLFRIGAVVEIFSVFDPLKFEQPAVNGRRLSEVVVEMAVSEGLATSDVPLTGR